MVSAATIVLPLQQLLLLSSYPGALSLLAGLDISTSVSVRISKSLSDQETCLSSSSSAAASASDSESSFPPLSSAKLVCEYHMAPQQSQQQEGGGGLTEGTVDYSKNPSVFGRILEGSLPSATIKESETLLSFVDRTPRAPLHALVIPKQHIPTVNSLTHHDLPLLHSMHDMAMEMIQHYHPHAYETNDYILCYHVPPFNSVDHLHLHVLAPKSKMNWLYRYGKYQVNTCWCTDEESLWNKLEKERK